MTSARHRGSNQPAPFLISPRRARPLTWTGNETRTHRYCVRNYDAQRDESREVFLMLLRVYLKPTGNEPIQVQPALRSLPPPLLRHPTHPTLARHQRRLRRLARRPPLSRHPRARGACRHPSLSVERGCGLGAPRLCAAALRRKPCPRRTACATVVTIPSMILYRNSRRRLRPEWVDITMIIAITIPSL